MDFINIDDYVPFFPCAFHHLLYAFLEVTTELCASKHRAHVHGIDGTAFQPFRHLPFVYSLCKPVDQCRLPYSRLADMKGIVLVLATEHLHGSLQLRLAPDEGIMVGHIVIDIGNEVFPFTVRPFVLAFIIGIVKGCRRVFILTGINKVIDKSHAVTADFFKQQIACPAVGEMKQGIGEVSYLHRVLARIIGLLRGFLDQFLTLHRRADYKFLFSRYPLLLTKGVEHLLLERREVVSVISQRKDKLSLVSQDVKKMLRSYKLMAQSLAELHGIIEHVGKLGAVFHFRCHNQTSLYVIFNGYPASRAMEEAIRVRLTARS